MKRVTFTSLRLEGFGVYNRSTLFSFPRGLAIDTRPNEMGKSTVLHGIQAVLFGLPHTNDGEKFGTVRFQSWAPSSTFSGTLELEIDGNPYRIQRDFQTHQTRIICRGNGPPLLFEGEANPMGRTLGIRRYREILGDLIAVTDETLFQSIFCLQQPLPDERQIPHEVQRLITGTGEAAGDRVLALLFQWFKEISRKTGETGIHEPGKRPTDQRTDGRLDTLHARLRELESARAEGEECFAQLKDLEQKSQKLRESVGRNRERQGETQVILAKIESYRENSKELSHLRERRDQLTRALQSYEENEVKRRELQRELEDRFPHLAVIPPELKNDFSRALAAQRKLQEAEAELKRPGEELAAILVEIEDVGRELSEEPDLAGRPDDFWSALQRRSVVRTQTGLIGKELNSLAARSIELKRKLELFHKWNTIPKHLPSFLEGIHRESETLKERWIRWQEKLANQERLKSQLDRRQIFTQPQIPEPDEILSAVATWERLAQESQAVLAQEEIEQRRAGRIRSSAKRMEVRRRILEGVGGSGAGVIVGWLIWFTNLVPPLVAVGLGLMVAFAITTILWRLPTSQQSLIEALTTALSGTQKRKGEIETKISEFKSRFEPLMKSLSLPSIDGGGLTALSKDFIEWRAAQQEYLTAELICRQAEIDLFGPLSKEEEPGSAGQTKTPEELPAPFPDLALLARSVGNIEFKNGSDLLYWLSQQEEENWRRWMDEAAEQAALHREIADLDDKQTRIKGDKTPGGLSFLEKELVDLNASCRPWALDVDIKAIEPRLRAVRQAEERQRRLLARKKELGNSIDNLKNDLNLVKLEWESWRMKLAPYLELAGGDPERLQQQLNDAQELHAQIRRAEQLRDQALAIQEGNNDDPESLKKNRDRLVEQWDFHHRAMRDLVKDSDALRVFEELEDAQQRDSYRQGLMDQLIELETHAKALESEFDDVRISLRSLKPEGSVHLAQAELEIRETRGELEHLEQRRDTILEAWRLMSDAVEELRRSFGPALAQEISRLFFLITQKDGRRIDLSPKLELEILENDQPCSSAQLSQGAGDQLTWSVRLALAQKIGGDIILPILMDDPFVNFDFERLTRAGDALSRLSQERQILIWTKDERLRAWGAPIRTELSPL